MKTNLFVLAATLFATVHTVQATGFVTYATDGANHNGTALPTRPGYLSSYTDPDFGTTVTRISDSTTAVDGSTNTSGGVAWGNTVRNVYSKVQAWNADMSLLLVENENRSAAGVSLGGVTVKKAILDGSTYAFLYGLSFSPWDYRWHPTDPDVLFYTSQNQLYKWSVSGGTSTLIHTFSAYSATNGAIDIGKGEGNLSADGRYIVITAAAAGSTTDVIVYDTTIVSPTDGTVSTLNLPSSKTDSRTGTSYAGPDWAAMAAYKP